MHGPGIGEADAFFEIIKGQHLRMLAGWFHNDAHWWHEYMDGLLESLGYTLQDLPAKFDKKARETFMDYFGL